MPLISVASPKGGVGKTTLTANLGYELQRIGWQVLVVDFDSQNGLRLHYAMPLGDHRGLAVESVRNRPWEDLIFETASGVLLLPFGGIDNHAAQRLHTFVRGDPDWMRSRLEPFLAAPDVLVLVDLPPGRSVFLEQVSPLAEINLAVMLADATSVAILPKLETGEFFEDAGGGWDTDRVHYVLNQVDIRRRLRRDVLTVLRGRLGERLAGVIYRDEAVQEAIGKQRLVADFAPDSKAAYDIAALARRLDDILGDGVAAGGELKVAMR
ncbi:MAG: cellulose biosynthesis protein BcsQ [Alphaproteobacteria bacterium]